MFSCVCAHVCVRATVIKDKAFPLSLCGSLSPSSTGYHGSDECVTVM